MLRELSRLIEAIDPPAPLIFRSNHASNALPLKGRLPKDRERLIGELDAALSGKMPLKPNWMRGL